MPERISVFDDEAMIHELESMLSNGETLEAMGRRFDVSPNRIKDEIRRRDIAHLRPEKHRQVHPVSHVHGFWNDPRHVERLTEMWNRGLSCSRIGMELGVSRNAVIGKVSRLGLQPRGTKYRKSDGLLPRAPRIKTTVASPWKPGRRTPFGTIVTTSPEHERRVRMESVQRLATPQETDIARVTFLELEDHHCRFPIGDPKEKSFGFCGDEKVPGTSYCLNHCCRTFEGPYVAQLRARMERHETQVSQVEREREDA